MPDLKKNKMIKLLPELVFRIFDFMCRNGKVKSREVCKWWCNMLDSIKDADWWGTTWIDVHLLRTKSYYALAWLEEHTKFVSATIEVPILSDVNQENVPMLYKMIIVNCEDLDKPKSIIQFATEACNIPLLMTIYTINSLGASSFEEYLTKYAGLNTFYRVVSNCENIGTLIKDAFYLFRLFNHVDDGSVLSDNQILSIMLNVTNHDIVMMEMIGPIYLPDWKNMDIEHQSRTKLSTSHIHRMIPMEFLDTEYGKQILYAIKSYPQNFHSIDHAIWVINNVWIPYSKRNKTGLKILASQIEVGFNVGIDADRYIVFLKSMVAELKMATHHPEKEYFNNAEFIKWYVDTFPSDFDAIIRMAVEAKYLTCGMYRYLYNKCKENRDSFMFEHIRSVQTTPATFDDVRWLMSEFPDRKIFLDSKLLNYITVSEFQFLVENATLDMFEIYQNIFSYEILTCNFAIFDMMWDVWAKKYQPNDCGNLEPLFAESILICSRMQTLAWICHKCYRDKKFIQAIAKFLATRDKNLTDEVGKICLFNRTIEQHNNLQKKSVQSQDVLLV